MKNEDETASAAEVPRRPGSVARPRRVRVKSHMVSVSEARKSLSTHLGVAQAGQDVIILTNSKPEGVLMSFERYEALLDRIEDLEDRLSIVDRDGDTVPFAEAIGDLDLDL
ncbi:type II toxin-antitoxin system Phd/YefM family antitoxin [Nocardia sp. NPDC051570]|uniref:type II toxin-antitoxin system Phd/YefM family antitoxin n=1 Tax=Nocardia sp. NPDC051570 TaxID=3364324 RepID=UPI0037961ED6